MTLKILPNELFVTEWGAVIRTRCPREHITEKMIHDRVVAANLGLGDHVRVQVLNHEKTHVLAYAEWVVISKTSEMKRVDIDDRNTRQFEATSFAIDMLADWKVTAAGKEAEKAAAPAKKAA